MNPSVLTMNYFNCKKIKQIRQVKAEGKTF